MEEEKFGHWSRKARIKEEPKRRAQLPANIFSGNCVYEKCVLQNGEILRLSILPAPYKIVPESFAVRNHHRFVEADQFTLPLGMQWQQSLARRFDLDFPLPEHLRCVGLGERYSELNLRGAKHTLVSTDNSDHDESADALYKAIPFLLLLDNEQSTALFIDSPAPQRWDLDAELDGIARIEILTQRPFSVYFFSAAKPSDLVAMYTELTGRTPLPPRWSLGHFQCRWSYGSEKIVRDIASEMRRRKIPCDCIVLDIDYMDGYRVFTHTQEHFPDFKQLIADLAAENLKTVTIVDPGVKQDKQYSVFKEGSKQKLFCLDHKGAIYIDEVWPGHSAFPDFVKEDTRKWWGKLHRFYLDNGVAGIWNDMNEPAFFRHKNLLAPECEQLPEPQHELLFHDLNGQKTAHLELRNLYGLLMSRATHEGLMDLRPNERPFVLTRSAYAGTQNYAAAWLGDNKSWWEHLRKAVPMLLNMGLCGITFAGVDIGGFGSDTSPELLIRWYEQGIFYPFFRNHSMMSSRAQEPWAFGTEVESKIRRLIETRYKLLPYLQMLFWQHLASGAPIMRPMFWHFPQDTKAASLSDQFMFGEDMLVAPVMERASRGRFVYFPEGRWHAFESNEIIEGPAAVFIELPLGIAPVWVREGAILPLAGPMQSTAEYAEAEICFHVYGDRARGYYIEDDGISFGYQHGDYGEWSLLFENGELSSQRKNSSNFVPIRKFAVKSSAAGAQSKGFSLS